MSATFRYENTCDSCGATVRIEANDLDDVVAMAEAVGGAHTHEARQ